jgi:hypothetical protein
MRPGDYDTDHLERFSEARETNRKPVISMSEKMV